MDEVRFDEYHPSSVARNTSGGVFTKLLIRYRIVSNALQASYVLLGVVAVCTLFIFGMFLYRWHSSLDQTLQETYRQERAQGWSPALQE